MGSNDSNIEEIFVDPEHALKRPNEVIFKFAFNEKGDLGLITSYQDVNGDPIFTGVSLSSSGMWLSKSPLAIKASIDPDALQNVANIFSPIRGGSEDSDTTQFVQFGLPSGRIFAASSLKSLFDALNNLRNDGDGSKYFGQPDFSNPPNPSKFSFDMGSFLDSFDATGEDDTDNPEKADDDFPLNDDPDNLG